MHTPLCKILVLSTTKGEHSSHESAQGAILLDSLVGEALNFGGDGDARQQLESRGLLVRKPK